MFFDPHLVYFVRRRLAQPGDFPEYDVVTEIRFEVQYGTPDADYFRVYWLRSGWWGGAPRSFLSSSEGLRRIGKETVLFDLDAGRELRIAVLSLANVRRMKHDIVGYERIVRLYPSTRELQAFFRRRLVGDRA